MEDNINLELLRIGDLVNLDRLGTIFERFSMMTGLTVGLIDCKTNEIIIKKGWSKACEYYHRTNPNSEKLCHQVYHVIENSSSYEVLSADDDIQTIQCPHGLFKGVKPIFFRDIHLASMFIGQMLFSEPDEGYFTQQAEKYGYETQSYLAAIREIPVIDLDKAANALSFLNNMATMIVELGLQRLEFLKKSEELVKSNQLFQTMTDFALDWIFWRDCQGNLIYNSPAFEKITGYTLEESKARPALFDELIYIDDMEKWYGHTVEYNPQGNPQPLELRIVTKLGKLRWIRHTCQLIYDEGGGYIGVRGSNTDITTEKLAFAALKESENKFRVLSEQHMLGLLIISNDKIKYANQALGDILELSPNQIHNQSCKKLITMIYHQDYSKVKALMEKCLTEKSITKERFRIKTSSNQIKWIEYYCREIPFEEGTAKFIIMIDITKQMNIQQKLMRNSKAVEESSDAIVIMEKQTGEITYTNKAFKENFGFSINDLNEKNGLLRLYPDRLQGKKMFLKVMQGSSWSGEIEVLTIANKKLWMYVRADAIRDTENLVDSILIVFTNINKLKLIEQRLWQSQNLESIGTLAGGIAHDFNNILAAISGYTELTIDELPKNSLASDNLLEVLKAISRAKDLVKQILTFSYYKEEERMAVNVDVILQETLKLLRPTIPTTVNIRLTVVAKQRKITANATQLHQVFMNLCINACQAMVQGGELEIILADKFITPEIADQYPNLVSGEYLQIIIKDSGCGMDKHVLSRIFQPFFTTKEVGAGSGMGLAMVHGIIKSHQGFISAESQIGVGSRFQILLPTWSAEQKQERIASQSDAKQILLVDDEVAIVKMLSQFLRKLGYRVVEMTNSEEALEIFKKQPLDFDLIIIDQTMPKVTGKEMSKQILSIRPEIPIIICTGFSNTMNLEEAKKIGIKEFCMKPISLSGLEEMVKRLL